MYHKSAATLLHSGWHISKKQRVTLQRYVKTIDTLITATFETGLVAMIAGYIGTFILMLYVSDVACHAFDSTMAQWIPMLFESWCWHL
jgi:hypothetical protein